MKANNSIKKSILFLTVFLTAPVCFGQFFISGGYQGGMHGSGGFEVVTGVDNFKVNDDKSCFVAYPNPFYEETTISFILPSKTEVELKVYDINSRIIKTLIPAKELKEGKHTIIWNGSDNTGNKIAKGIYYIQFKSYKDYYIKKIIFM